MRIEIQKPTQEKLDQLNIKSWPIWECEPSTFDWHYGESEVCYLLEGKVTVKTANQEVEFSKGDLVRFPAGMDCVWTVKEKVRKHYKFE